MRDLKDKKQRSVKDGKSAKQPELMQSISLNDKDKQAVEFLKKHPFPKKNLPQ